MTKPTSKAISQFELTLRHRLRDAIKDAGLPNIKVSDIELFAKAAMPMLEQFQNGEWAGLPAPEPFTCGNGHLAAERTLRILQESAKWGRIDADAIEAIEHLVSKAGAAFARRDLRDYDPEEFPF